VEPLAEAKKQIRATAVKDRAAAFGRHGSAAGHRLASFGLGFAGAPGGATVSGFSAIGDEIDPLPLLAKLTLGGHRACLPVMQGKAAPLLFRSWKPGDLLRATVWGIREPLPSAESMEPDVLLVPLLVFDKRGYRLGYGGGFYDRTIAGLRARKTVIAIGVAFDEQRIDAVPHTDHDQRLDWVLTPSGPIAVG
jgi:5-formyltetrahydrofolate cyclo-ligase